MPYICVGRRRVICGTYNFVAINYLPVAAHEWHKYSAGNMKLRRDSEEQSGELSGGGRRRGDTAPPEDAVRLPQYGRCSCRVGLVIGSEAKGVAGALTRSRRGGGGEGRVTGREEEDCGEWGARLPTRYSVDFPPLPFAAPQSFPTQHHPIRRLCSPPPRTQIFAPL